MNRSCYDFLFASLDDKTLPKKPSLLLKERICSCRSVEKKGGWVRGGGGGGKWGCKLKMANDSPEREPITL